MAASMRRASVVWFVALALALSLVATLAAPVSAVGFTVNTEADAQDAATGDGVCEATTGVGDCTLRAAIEEANSLGGADSITVPAGTYTLTNGELEVIDAVSIVGEGAATTIIDGADEVRVLHVEIGAVAISNVTITGGAAEDTDGGGIYVEDEATLTLSNSSVVDNHVSDAGSGGGIYLDDGADATISGSFIGTVLSPNTTEHHGGGIFVGEGATLSLGGGSTVNGNSAGQDGGGIYIDGNSQALSTATITGSTVSGNAAASDGGGIFVNDDATATITGSTISGNAAESDGGGISVDGTATLSGSTVSTNEADLGGGIYIDSQGTVNLNAGSVVSGNDAFEGGGIANEGSDTLNMNGSTVSGNKATSDGGGIWNRWDAVANIVNSTIDDNTAGAVADDEIDGNGGGIFSGFCCGGELNIAGSTISNNQAEDGSGGGIYTDSSGSSLTSLVNSTVSGNIADENGGGIYVDGNLETLFTTVASNVAGSEGDGGGIWTQGSAAFYGTIIADNGAAGDCHHSKTGIESYGSNLDTDDTCIFNHQDDLPDSTAKLNDLAANPPGATKTHALQFDSPAVDAVQPASLPDAQAEFLLVGLIELPTCPAVDQRGVTRPQDGDEDGVAVCDIGAYELIPVPPTVLISDAPDVVEGNSGTTIEATFTVTLSRAAAGSVTVSYTAANGTAGAPGDYLAEAGVVTFIPGGDLTETVTITVVGDGLDEPNEDFVVNLSVPVGATVADGQGTGRILDDDGPAALSINDVTVTEGDSGFVNATFTVRLLPASSSSVTVAYATANGTAISPADYESTTGTVTFAVGDTEETITVRVAGDTIGEGTETFVVNLSSPTGGAIISDAQGTGTIVDNEGTLGSSLPNTATVGVRLEQWLPAIAIGLVVLASATVTRGRRRLSIRTR